MKLPEYFPKRCRTKAKQSRKSGTVHYDSDYKSKFKTLKEEMENEKELTAILM